MFTLNFTSQQSLSSLFASRLSRVVDLQLTYKATEGWLSNQDVEDVKAAPVAQAKPSTETNAKLVIHGEGLNLYIISMVLEQLDNKLALGAGCFRHLPSRPGAWAIVFAVNNPGTDNLSALLESLAARYQVELALLGATPTLAKPGILLMDMDSTVIDVECIDEIAHLAGVGEQVAEVTELAMQGKLEFSQSLVHRVACLEGADSAILQQVRDALPLMPGLSHLLQVLKQHNWKVAIASGGFTYFADYLAERLELDAAVANNLGVAQGKLTGKVNGGIVDAKVKAETIGSLAQQWDVPRTQTIAMGDGANDLQMMQAAGLGVAFHAKPVVRQQADAAIRFAGLDALLWLLD